MTNPRTLQEIDEQLDSLSAGPAALALMEEAIRVCDARGLVSEGFDRRVDLMDMVYKTGDWDQLLLHFGWCLQRVDEDRDRYDTYWLMWQYKWVVNEGVRMPQLRADRVIALVDDLERRFRDHGDNSTGHCYRALVFNKLGRLEEGRAAFERWVENPDGRLGDCDACRPGVRSDLLLELGRDEEALEVAHRVVHSGRTCSEEPDRSHGRCALPKFRRGQIEESRQHFTTAYRHLKRTMKLIEPLADLLAYVGAAGDDDSVATMLQRHIPTAVRHQSGWDRMRFWGAARLALTGLLERGQTELPLKLPDVEGFDGRTETLLAWSDQQLSSMYDAFEKRNGNRFAAEYVDRTYPLSAVR